MIRKERRITRQPFSTQENFFQGVAVLAPTDSFVKSFSKFIYFPSPLTNLNRKELEVAFFLFFSVVDCLFLLAVGGGEGNRVVDSLTLVFKG